MEEALQHPELRKHIQKLYYADEWAQSIVDSHPESAATSSMLEQFHQELDAVRRAMSQLLPSARPITRGWRPPAIKQFAWL